VLHLVPRLPGGHVAEAEIGGEIDHAHTSIQQRPRLLHADAVGRGEEDDVALF
jgi:hypothetical protein